MTAPLAKGPRHRPQRDAASLEIRPISPDDKRGLAEGFAQLGEESRYRRFLSPHRALSAAELRFLTEVDHHDHEALVAYDPQTGKGVGVARYVRSTDDPHTAELAVAVVDDWHRRGVGTRLTSALAQRAREEGITVFTALLLTDNELVRNLVNEIGDVSILNREHGTVEVAIELPEHGSGRLASLIRAVAAGALTPFAKRDRGDG